MHKDHYAPTTHTSVTLLHTKGARIPRSKNALVWSFLSLEKALEYRLVGHASGDSAFRASKQRGIQSWDNEVACSVTIDASW